MELKMKAFSKSNENLFYKTKKPILTMASWMVCNIKAKKHPFPKMPLQYMHPYFWMPQAQNQ